MIFDWLQKWVLRKHLVDERNGVRFYATGHIHKNIALQISRNGEFDRPMRPINVFVGAHRWMSRSLPKHEFNIGIQTEQFFDERGERLWGLTDADLPSRLTKKFSHILDLDHNNRKAYLTTTPLENVTFGPYIFPTKQIHYRAGQGHELIFVGAMNERRAERLRHLKKLLNIRSVSKLYNEELEDQIRLSAGLINIHFNDGLYTEWPRVLLAYLCGKVIVSELLASPMIANRHYILADSAGNIATDDRAKQEIFSQVEEEIVRKFEFRKFLDIVASPMVSKSSSTNVK